MPADVWWPPDRDPADQGLSKLHPSEAQTPEIVIPAKAGIQAGWGGETPL